MSPRSASHRPRHDWRALRDVSPTQGWISDPHLPSSALHESHCLSRDYTRSAKPCLEKQTSQFSPVVHQCMDSAWVWLLAGPIKCNWPSVTLWSVFQYPVTNGYSYVVWLRLTLPQILLILSEKLYCCFHIHHQLLFGYIRSHSAILVSNYSFIVLVNILLFQNYSYQICNLLFSKLCQHNRLRPRLSRLNTNTHLPLYKTFRVDADFVSWQLHKLCHTIHLLASPFTLVASLHINIILNNVFNNNKMGTTWLKMHTLIKVWCIIH